MYIFPAISHILPFDSLTEYAKKEAGNNKNKGPFHERNSHFKQGL